MNSKSSLSSGWYLCLIGLLTAVLFINGCGKKSNPNEGSPSGVNSQAFGSPFDFWRSSDPSKFVIDLSEAEVGFTASMAVWSSDTKLICECNVLVTGPESNGFAGVSSCTTKISSASAICEGLENNYSYSVKGDELTACILGSNDCFSYSRTKLEIQAGSSCILNPQTGQYTSTSGQLCNPSATQITCPANGIYTNNLGQQMPCTPGQIVNTGGGLGYPGQYQYPQYMNQDGCTYANYQYGAAYVPVVLGGQLQCLRYDLVNPVSQGTPYYNNYDYWYAYPPDYYQQQNGFCLGLFGVVNYCSYN